MRTIAVLALLALSASPALACSGTTRGAQAVKAAKNPDLKQPRFAHTRCTDRYKRIEKAGKSS